MDWQFTAFDDLDTARLFALMKLRVDVFVVEQACAYPELDDHDTASSTRHLLGIEQGTLAAYARAMPHTDHIHIGRVVVAPAFRSRGLGRTLMQTMMAHWHTRLPERDLFLAAQTTVQDFYQSLGFLPISDSYLEDGIAHVNMRRRLRTRDTAMPPNIKPSAT